MTRAPLRLLDLFSGIGGFSLGLERSGAFRTVAFCEIDSHCRQVLARHWPGVPIYGDVREVTSERLRDNGVAVDAISGGFPCQDISNAGRQAGIDGERSGLWTEIARLTGELRPRYVLLENVSALLYRGLGRVLGGLAALGYDAEWHCIPAGVLGAPQERDRIWIIAYPSEAAARPRPARSGQGGGAREGWSLADSDGHGRQGTRSRGGVCGASRTQGLLARHLADCGAGMRGGPGLWPPEPPVGRVAHGIPQQLDRLHALGNAIVPQIPELIGRAIARWEGFTQAACPGGRTGRPPGP